ncbi:MAG: hypothetical protein M1509_04075 [Nitrospirae bacterium]|uniref:Uncharacterized protein n=1 Tax=Leptospirillum ferrodiazotrophum TaxID=412449 RepID=C6HZ92_9BACT|nr:MAG: protein of unknown function [Leptospirillum ferrodiazotrophum]MCL5953669.1 hypothetical protein [Nitrospirota bacterium]
MPFIRRSDRSAFVRRLFSGLLLPGILSMSSLPALAGEGAPSGASTASPESEYSSLTLPVSNFGFRGVARDRYGSLYLSSTLKNGLFVLPPSCRSEDCATLIPLTPGLSDPGDVVADPVRGGAYVLLRLGDKVDYLPRGCLAAGCLEVHPLPERPAYPFRAVYDRGRQRLAVLDRLSNKIVLISSGCQGRHCLSFLPLPPKSGTPSGLAYDSRRKDLWVSYRQGTLVRVPPACRRLSCETTYPPGKTDLTLTSPVVSDKDDALYLSAKKGGAIGWVDLAENPPKLRLASLETTSGMISHLVPLPSGGVYLVTGLVSGRPPGESHPHGGFFSRPQGSAGGFDLRLFALPGGTPSALSPGGHNDLWMTVDDQDALFRLSLTCKRKSPVLSKVCVTRIPFEKIETLYHSRYHQEIQVPQEPSPDLSRPSD